MATELHPDERVVSEELWAAVPKDESGVLGPGGAVVEVLRTAVGL